MEARSAMLFPWPFRTSFSVPMIGMGLKTPCAPSTPTWLRIMGSNYR